MAKKRVFELARELGVANRDLIDKLQRLGFEVKTHSSTVDYDEVRRALRREDDERKAKTDERRISRGVIRRRKKDDGGTTTTVVRRRPAAPPAKKSEGGEAPRTAARSSAPAKAASSAPAPAARPAPVRRSARPTSPRRDSDPPAAVARAEPPTPPARSARPPAVESPPRNAEPPASAPEVVSPPPLTSVDAHPQEEAPPAPALEVPPVVEAGVEETAHDEPVAAVPEAEEEPKKERREARTARPDKKPRIEEEFDEEDAKPDLEDFGISESDFMSRASEEISARVAPPPPSASASPKKEEEPKTKIVRQIDPNILKARLSASKRPEPPKDWGKPGLDVAASPVKILDVRTDATGKRKELVDVQQEASRNKRGGARRREEMSARDLLEHRRGQVYYPAPSRKRVRPKRASPKRPEPIQPVAKQPIRIGETITVAELSQQMSKKATEIIAYLMRNGVMANINQPIDHETASMVCEEFGYEVESLLLDEEELLLGEAQNKKSTEVDPNAKPRAPVVTVMGHVDHGKTSLLDRIRKANVAAGEAGGITQAIAGYQVQTAKGPVTFLDTPGHAAFTAMRARGANVTDIVVLVVAADDGVMPQTKEAIDHARAAEVPLIVAVNKIDKADANPDRVLQQLADNGILVEDWGGDVLSRKISAKTGEAVDELLELIALQAEIMELRANPKAPAVAKVIEGHVHKGRGPVATVLVQEGTLEKGHIVVVGENVGRIRALIGDGGKPAKAAGPSVPVEILGLDGVPNPGDDLRVAKDLDAAKKIAQLRRDERRASALAQQSKVSLQDIINQIQAGDQKELKIVIKADVQGSIEALRGALTQLSTQQVKVNVIRGDVGAVTESDVEFAKASDAIIVGFGVRPDTKALKSARALDVDIRSHNIIYEVVDEVRLAMQGLLSPIEKERYLGRAEVRQTFNVPKVGTVAGCAVVDGIISRSASIRLIRDGRVIYDGKLSSLKRFKDDVREVKEGFECGMGIERFNDIKVGDIIEAYEVVLQQATLDDPAVADQPAEARP